MSWYVEASREQAERQRLELHAASFLPDGVALQLQQQQQRARKSKKHDLELKDTPQAKKRQRKVSLASQ